MYGKYGKAFVVFLKVSLTALAKLPALSITVATIGFCVVVSIVEFAVLTLSLTIKGDTVTLIGSLLMIFLTILVTA